MPRLSRLSRVVFFTGIITLPFLHFPGQVNGFEGPKIFWFQRWVELLVVLYVLAKPKGKFPYLLLAYFFWNLVTSYFGIDFKTSFYGLFWRGQGLWLLAHYLALALVVPAIFSGRAVAVSAGLVAGYEIWTLVAKSLFDWPVFLYLGRPVGSFSQPDFLAGFLAICLPFVFYVREWWRWGLVVLISAGIFLTGSKGAVLAVAGAVVILGLVRYRKKVLGIILAAGVMVSAVYWFFNIPLTSNETISRQRIYGRGLLAVTQRPILGYGLENYELAVAGIDYPFKIRPEYDAVVDKAHNETLEILVSSGIVGLGIWLVIVFGTLRRFVKKRQYVFLVALLVFLIKAQTNVVSTMEYALFWILVGLGLTATGREAKRRRS